MKRSTIVLLSALGAAIILIVAFVIFIGSVV
jgi:hypothetical protein